MAHNILLKIKFSIFIYFSAWTDGVNIYNEQNYNM